MSSARLITLAAAFVCTCTLALFTPLSAPAQTINYSLNVFYASPSNSASGGTWELVAKSSDFGIAGIEVHLQNIATAAVSAPRGTVNGNNPAGFNLFLNQSFPTLSLIQTPNPGLQQGAFYGVGQLTNGSPNYPGQIAGTNSEGPSLTSLTAPQAIPWATGDAFNDPAWSTAARLLSGTFLPNTTPAFTGGNNGNVFQTLGTATSFGNIVSASTITTIVRTNFGQSSGDYNLNGVVDAADYIIWRQQNGTSVPNGSGADGTGDGQVNNADFTFWRARFGNVVPGSGSGGSLSTGAVPEPWSGTLLAIAAMLAALVSRPFSRRFRTPAVAPVVARSSSLRAAGHSVQNRRS
jgi:hypothetical protein